LLIACIAQVLSGIISVLAVGVAAIPTGIIGSGFSELIEQRRNRRKDEAEMDVEVDVATRCQACTVRRGGGFCSASR
jgi:hypothetical protein